MAQRKVAVVVLNRNGWPMRSRADGLRGRAEMTPPCPRRQRLHAIYRPHGQGVHGEIRSARRLDRHRDWIFSMHYSNSYR